ASAVGSSSDSASFEEFELASRCLVSTAAYSTEGRSLLVRWLPRLQIGTGLRFQRPQRTSFAGDAENADALAAVLPEIVRRDLAEQLVELYLRHDAWGHAALDALLDLTASGIAEQQIGRWLERHGQ